jgi:hypothetical protein
MAAEALVDTGIELDYATYAAAAALQVQYDDENHQTIGGVPVLERMHLGVFEEWAEIFGHDTASVEDSYGYSRADALRGGLAYTDLFRGVAEGDEQIKRHMSEFGDSLWYVTNYLSYFGISLGEAMSEPDYTFEYTGSYDGPMLEAREHLNSHRIELADFIESGRDLFSFMGSLFEAASAGHQADEPTLHALKQLSRQYVESMSVLASVTFGVRLDEIMAANLDKIAGRWKNGTVLGSGDVR